MASKDASLKIITQNDDPMEQTVRLKKYSVLFAVCLVHVEMFYLSEGNVNQREIGRVFEHLDSDPADDGFKCDIKLFKAWTGTEYPLKEGE